MKYEVYRIGDVCSFIDYRGKTPPKTDIGIPLITAKIVKNGHILKPQEFISEDFYEDWMKRGIPKVGDIVFTTEAPLGEVAQIRSNEKLAFAQRTIIIEPDEKLLSPDYLFYALQDSKLKNRIKARASGTTVLGIKSAELKKVEIDLPPILVQRKIASLLKPLDEKILFNENLNQNLEQQAQMIFEKEFLSNEEVPLGWQESNLLDIADYLNGLAMQKYRPIDGDEGLPVLKIKELRQGMCDDSSERCSSNIKPEYIVNDGDVIFSWSGSLLVDFWCGGTCGLNQHLFKVTSSKYDKWFYYAWTKHHLIKFAAIAADMATTMGHIKREELAKSKVLIPSAEDYDRIGSLLQPIYDLIITNRLQNRRLSYIRDSLLPKIMSGELDVSEVCI